MSPSRALLLALAFVFLAALVSVSAKKCPKDCFKDVKDKIRKSTKSNAKDTVCNAPDDFKKCLKDNGILNDKSKKTHETLKRIIQLPCHLLTQGETGDDD